MNRIPVRKFSSFLLLLSFSMSAVVFVPAQTNTPVKSDTTEKKQAQTDQKDQNKKPTAAAQPSPTPAASNGKPLAPNEDPSQIGKRNINGGSGKFLGWLGGSKDKEMAIGRQLALEVEQQSKLVDDPLVTEYINRVGQNVVLHSDAKVPFTIKVIDSDEVNAFALPGGFFFVNKGLILAADNEAELAGVMAHEIGHVAARHAMENQGKGTLMNIGMIGVMIFGGPIAGAIVQNGGGILGGLAMLKFSRAAETEADRLGVQYLYASGYDPTAMSTMFEKLASQNKKKPGSFAKLFSTHPQSLDRRDASLALVARFPERDEYVISTSEFQRVKSHLLKLSNAKAGVTTDVDDTDSGKPTLKRRQPEPDASGDPTTNNGSNDSTDSSSSGPPKLKKRGEPTSTPTPDKP